MCGSLYKLCSLDFFRMKVLTKILSNSRNPGRIMLDLLKLLELNSDKVIGCQEAWEQQCSCQRPNYSEIFRHPTTFYRTQCQGLMQHQTKSSESAETLGFSWWDLMEYRTVVAIALYAAIDWDNTCDCCLTIL